MKYRITIDYAPITLNVKVKTDTPEKLHLVVYDACCPDIKFTERYKTITGDETFYVRMPISPEVAIVEVYGDKTGRGVKNADEKNFKIVSVEKTPLERRIDMDDIGNAQIRSFVDLHKKGLIYRGFRMVNWDPEAKTTLSDEEVIFEEQQGKLFYIKYEIQGTSDFVTVATTRPETIFGDTAICINPNDERFIHLKGKNAIVPICGRVIPIIQDEYVDVEFGTGCLKVTPAHDTNDKTLGEKHHLEIIDIFNDDASLNSYGLHYQGKDRFVVREEIAKELDTIGSLVKVENHLNKVGTSERTKAVIEPRLSDQWFLKMEDLVKPAIKAVLVDDEIKLYPKKFDNTYKHWLENIRDWNISRQLWWGQQIPAYYYGDGKEDYVVAESIEEALVLAQEKTKNNQLTIDNLNRRLSMLRAS